MKKHLITTGIMLALLVVASVFIFCVRTYPELSKVIVGGTLIGICSILLLIIVYVAILGGVERHMARREGRKSEQYIHFSV